MIFLMILLAALFIFVVTTVAAFVYLPWWAALLVSLGVFLSLVLAGRLSLRVLWWDLKRRSTQMLARMGLVMRDAGVQVHIVLPAAAPYQLIPGSGEEWRGDGSDDFDETDDEGPLAYYRIDVTIIPKRLVGSTDTWNPMMLQVVPHDAPAWDDLEPTASSQAGHLREVEVERAGSFTPLEQEGMELKGRQRIQALVGVPAGVQRLKFRYFTEDFGLLEVPD